MPVLLGWAFICLSLALWSTTYHPIVGIPFGVLAVMVMALGFVVRNGDWRGVLHRPEAARAGSAEPDASPSWPGVAARSLTALIVAPATGMGAGLLMWLWMPGHEATRFVGSVLGFVVVFAAAQLWGLSARRPWRALGLMSAVGIAIVIPTFVAAGGLG